ncbi:MAG: DUF3347 domain-containing protein [Myxococcota bacterium]
MKTATAVLYVCALGFAVGTSHASEFDQAMQPVLTEYLKIQAALAADRTDGMRDAAAAIEASARGLNPQATGGPHAEHYAGIPAELVGSCEALQAAQGLDATREAFKKLSRPVAVWVGMAKPPDTSVMYCPMAEAVWVQHGTDVANPYYGPRMLSCGQKVGGSD